MDLNELQSAQSRERQTDSLQQLRESFYKDAGEFIQQLHRERERAAEEADDPWDAPEVNRLSDDIDTAEGTVEAIYERRVGKIVKMASLAAADMPTEDEGLTTEERSLFETLVGAIEENRARVEAVIDGENPAAAAADVDTPEPAAGANQADPADADPAADAGPTDASAADRASEPSPADGDRRDVPGDPDELGDAPGTAPPADAPSADAPADDSAPSPPPDAPTEASGVDAADLMGDGSETAESVDSGEQSPDDDPRDRPPQADGGSSAVDPATDAPTPPPGGGGGESPDADSTDAGAESDPSVDRATVKITSDVGEIFGVDDRSYDLTAEDVVTLPEANAGPLVERDAAERLD
ncbi:DNA replication complex GINS family protein [Halosimplex pelagicum]|uniref:DNA replication complex GINS family protein n=1 Tax=Halosimplex pelagicum TaxID=869886 RepID=A0A7D5PEB3_9EURY|nr:DNA replication complex GINS family protein [Halosimplex pelagicum]QLH85042.1 DNA replication complex GINS family protein [Halosimplex pelagicum]